MVRKLKIPVTAVRSLKIEMDADFEYVVREKLQLGWSLHEAQTSAKQQFSITDGEIDNLERILNSKIYLLSEKYNLNFNNIEILASLIPSCGILIYMYKEVPMYEFLHQGGAFAWILTFIGVAALGLQVRLLFSWFIAKNHYNDSFEKSLKLPIKLGLVCFLLGLLGTAMGLFLVFSAMPDVPPERFNSIIVTGMKESLVNLVLGTTMLSVIYSVQIFISELSRKDQLPVS